MTSASHPVAHVLGEGLVEPEVVPPLRRRGVAEPLVRELVSDRRGADALGAARDLGGEDVGIAEGDAAGVLHGAGVELGNERLVVVAEGIALVEESVELVEALPGHGQDLLGVPVEVRGDALAGGQAEPDPVVLGADGVPRPGDERDEVRRQWLGLLELPDTGLDLLTGRVADDRPLAWRPHVERVRRLQIGLVEAGEDAGSRVQEGHAVDVVAAVGGIDAAMQALAVRAEAHHGVDEELVGAGLRRQGQAASVQRLRIQHRAVEPDLVDPDRLDVDEGLGAGRLEDDGGPRTEGVLVRREIERDVVGGDLHGRESVGRLAVLQAQVGGSGHACTLCSRHE